MRLSGFNPDDFPSEEKVAAAYHAGAGAPADQVPSQIDWRRYGYVTAVKDSNGRTQTCQSCWAFATVNTLG